MPTLNWIGREQIINHHKQVPYYVLNRQYSYDSEGQHSEDNGSQNMIIHGDNLFALKSLLPQYEGKIKCIYIDPPYNKGISKTKWVYSDDVKDPIFITWLKSVVGDEGEDYSRHDKWLCMMYPRLKLLHRMLSDDGTILISIDDSEQASLRSICDEIFGRSNFVCQFIWKTDGHTDNQDKITGVHEYIICYAKNKEKQFIANVVDPNTSQDSKILRSFAENSITKNGYKNPPSVIELPIGFPCEAESLYIPVQDNILQFYEEAVSTNYITRELTKKYDVTYPAKLDEMVVKNYRLTKPCRVFSGWMNNGKLNKFINNNCAPIADDGASLKFYLSKNGVIYYRKDGRTTHYIQSVLENMGTTETNKYMLEEMGIKFDYPKPVTLIKFLISCFSEKNDIILDSFAGSGTTAHAVIAQNKVDGGKRRFVIIEMLDYADSTTASRIKHIINRSGDSEEADTSFSYYELGETLLKDGLINEDISLELIRQFVFYTETKTAYKHNIDMGYYLGSKDTTAYYFCYEKDRTVALNDAILNNLKPGFDSYVIYADVCYIPDDFLKQHNIVFKKIPRDLGRF